MPNMNRRTWLAASGTALIAGGLTARASDGETKWKTASPRDTIRQRYFPNVLLTTHEGKKVRFYDDLIKDKIVFINMMYATCEGVCPRITANLLQVQKLLGKRVGRDVFIYSITLKPEMDTPEVLRKHAAMHHVRPGWLFLTGAPADIELLRRKLGFVDPDPEVDKDKSNHIGNIRYGNEALMEWGACPGLSKAAAIAETVAWVDWPKQAAMPAKGRGGRK